MEQKINTITWTLSGAVFTLLVLGVYTKTQHGYLLMGIGAGCLVVAGAVYYLGNAIMELKNKKK